MTRREAIFIIVREYLDQHSKESRETNADWALDISGDIESMIEEVAERVRATFEDLDDEEAA